MFRSLRTLAILGAFAAAAHASTISYDLAGDFSDVNNPNGAWSFQQGSTLLQHFAALNNGNPFYAVETNGFWGASDGNLNSDTPTVSKPTGSGSAAGETDLDFVAGDVITHSPNAGSDTFITWTAPSDGTVDVSGSIWYAHSSVTRSNDFSFSLGASVLDSGTVSTSSFGNINSASTFSDTALAVTAGEQFTLDLKKTSGQDFGSLNGVDMTVSFTSAVPEPGTLALGGLAMVGLLLRRRFAV